MKTTVFLDRDGVINEKALPHKYITKPDDFVLLSKAAEGVALLNCHGILTFVVTNQQGIAKGELTKTDLKAIHDRMQTLLFEKGAHIDDVYVCPHLKDTCCCRKPATGLLEKAKSDHSLIPEKCWMIGDSLSDILCGKRFGAKTILIGTDNNCDADFLCENLFEAAKIVCNAEKGKT